MSTKTFVKNTTKSHHVEYNRIDKDGNADFEVKIDEGAPFKFNISEFNLKKDVRIMTGDDVIFSDELSSQVVSDICLREGL